jgi:predicted metal-binding membrane protein
VLSASSVAAAPRRDRFLIWACIVLVTALAWAYLVHLDRQMSSSMAHDRMMAEMGMTMDMPRTTADVFFTFAMWVVMMVGMMAGAAAPMLLLFAGAQAGLGSQRTPMALPLFGLGYLTVWVGFSACAALAQEALHRAAMLSPAMAAASPRLSGAILIAAGAYQLTPFKGACLTRCRSPLGFLMTGWRDGAFGAFRMGLAHGTYCLGCCWALMGVLFAVGVMNLLWVAALTVLVLIEKVGPWGHTVARVAGAAIIVFGIVQEVAA